MYSYCCCRRFSFSSDSRDAVHVSWLIHHTERRLQETERKSLEAERRARDATSRVSSLESALSEATAHRSAEAAAAERLRALEAGTSEFIGSVDLAVV